MIKSNIFILTIAFSITFLSVSAQEQKKDPELEVNKLRNEIRKEIKDSLKNAQPTLKTTNNNGIRRDKLNINYQVNEIILSNDSIVMNEIRALGTAIEIPEVDGEIVKKAWIKKIKRKTKSKVNSTNEGISIKSTLIDELRRAFRARAKELHPDTGPQGSETAFIALREAFETLMATAPKPATAPDSTGGLPTAPPSRALKFEMATSQTTAGTINLMDTPRRAASETHRRVQTNRPSDIRGRSFAAHLATALATDA